MDAIAKPDICCRQDLKKLLTVFYQNVFTDPTIGFIFTEVVKLNIEDHLPKITDFWETLLFGKTRYKGNPMQTHIDLSHKTPMQEKQFLVWLEIWHKTIDSLFVGTKAFEAKTRAKDIANLMLYKIHQAQQK